MCERRKIKILPSKISLRVRVTFKITGHLTNVPNDIEIIHQKQVKNSDNWSLTIMGFLLIYTVHIYSVLFLWYGAFW